MGNDVPMLLQKNLIFGVQGLDNILTIKERYYQKNKSHMGGEFNPWYKLDPHLSQLPGRINREEKIINEEGFLSKLANFSLEGNYPLGKLGNCEPQMSVFENAAVLNQNLISQAQKLISKVTLLPWVKKLSDELIYGIIPLKNTNKEIEGGFSIAKTRGIIYMSINEDATLDALEFPINYIHELGHQSLMYYQLVDEIFKCDVNTTIYSGIKKMHRPVHLALHGLCALRFMQLACRELMKDKEYFPHKKLLKERYDFFEESSKETICSFKRAKIKFTKIGKRIFKELMFFHQRRIL